jgi:hypothetical protein
MDNSMSHNARKISLELEHSKIERAPHPADSPDISHVAFGCLVFSKKLTEHELSTSNEIIGAITTTWNDATFEESQSVFYEWIQRITWVIEHWGSITMNNCYSFLKEFSLVEKARGVRTF